MLLFPAIDLKDGKVVRLLKGDFDTVHQVADDPVTTAKAFLAAGANYIHMVDLDGARGGVRKNSEIVRAVAQTGIKVELGVESAPWPIWTLCLHWASGGPSSAPPLCLTPALSEPPLRPMVQIALPWASTH